MAAQKLTRLHLVEKLEKRLDPYNAATTDAQQFFEKLKTLIAEMSQGAAPPRPVRG